jgi:hypothetical protein
MTSPILGFRATGLCAVSARTKSKGEGDVEPHQAQRQRIASHQFIS